MRRIISSIVALLTFAAANVSAQVLNQSATATATVTVNRFLTVTKTQDLAFGSVFANQGAAVQNPAGTFAKWTVATDPGNFTTVSMIVPTTLDDGAKHIPFSCPATSGYVSDGAGQVFNPATGVPSFAVSNPTGTYDVYLGHGASFGSAYCTINTTGVTPGNYTGNITLTVTVP